MVNIKDLKKAAAAVGDRLGVSSGEAARIIGSFHMDPGKVSAVLSGDMAPAVRAAGDLGIPLKDQQENSSAGPVKKTTSSRAKKSAGKKTEKRTGAEAGDLVAGPGDGVNTLRKDNTDINAGGLEVVTGEIVYNDDLPASVVDDVENIISDYCIKYNVDDMRKASASVWRGACMAVGFNLKKTKILHDTKKEKLYGGIHYSGDRVAALVGVWAYLCSLYDKAPLAADFIAFCGVSSSWFYNCDGSRGVTASGTCVYKKLLALQESGLSSALVDGRKNPTGMIFFLKNWHGWKDSREVVHTDGGAALSVEKYPDFPLLEENSSGGGDI